MIIKITLGSFILILLMGFIFLNQKASFLIGGAFINIGYFFQDRIHNYNFNSTESDDTTLDEILNGFQARNNLASNIRECDTRKFYFIIRNAGSIIEEKEEEMLELAVSKGVKLIVFTRHTNCAAESIKSNPIARLDYPFISKSIEMREANIRRFLNRPKIKSKISEGKLSIRHAVMDTKTKRLILFK
jgi:uncharacterized protein YggL (DUF469 family)